MFVGITRCPETVGAFVYVLLLDLLLTIAAGQDLILLKLPYNISIPLVAS